MFLRQKSVILPFVISHFESGHFMTFLRVIFLILRKQCMLLTFDDWPIWSWGYNIPRDYFQNTKHTPLEHNMHLCIT